VEEVVEMSPATVPAELVGQLRSTLYRELDSTLTEALSLVESRRDPGSPLLARAEDMRALLSVLGWMAPDGPEVPVTVGGEHRPALDRAFGVVPEGGDA
jgi:hypothetical protein